jgi:hypothetical protein
MSGEGVLMRMSRTFADSPGALGRAWQALPANRRLAAGATVGLFLTLFLPWYQETGLADAGSRVQTTTASLTGWAAFSWVEAALLLVAAGVLALLVLRAQGHAFHLPGGDGAIITGAGGLSCLLVIWRIFDKQGVTRQGQFATTSGIEWGIFIALGVAGMLAYAGSRIRTELLAGPSPARDAPADAAPGPWPADAAPGPWPEHETPSSASAKTPRPASPKTPRPASGGGERRRGRPGRAATRRAAWAEPVTWVEPTASAALPPIGAPPAIGTPPPIGTKPATAEPARAGDAGESAGATAPLHLVKPTVQLTILDDDPSG